MLKVDWTIHYQRELEMFNAAMSDRIVQKAYGLLSACSETEYKTRKGHIDFVCDVQDLAIISRRYPEFKRCRAAILKRTVDKPKTRAAYNAFMAIYTKYVNDNFDWKGQKRVS